MARTPSNNDYSTPRIDSDNIYQGAQDIIAGQKVQFLNSNPMRIPKVRTTGNVINYLSGEFSVIQAINAGETIATLPQDFSTNINGLFSVTSDRLSGWGQADTSGTAFNITDIIINGETRIAVGTVAFVLRSLDGEVWIVTVNGAASTQTSGVFFSVTNQFVTVGASGSNHTSTTGQTWSAGPAMGTAANMRHVREGNGILVAVGGTVSPGVIVTTPDMITWTVRPSPASVVGILQSVAYGNGMYVTVGDSGSIAVSNDAATWTDVIAPLAVNFTDVIHDGNQFIVCGDNGSIMTSPDGASGNWTDISPVIPVPVPNFTSITYNGTSYVFTAVNDTSNNLYLSNDLVSFIPQQNPTTGNGISLFSGAVDSNNEFIVGGESSTILISNFNTSIGSASIQISGRNIVALEPIPFGSIISFDNIFYIGSM